MAVALVVLEDDDQISAGASQRARDGEVSAIGDSLPDQESATEGVARGRLFGNTAMANKREVVGVVVRDKVASAPVLATDGSRRASLGAVALYCTRRRA